MIFKSSQIKKRIFFPMSNDKSNADYRWMNEAPLNTSTRIQKTKRVSDARAHARICLS
jgi:hypothetical protein